MQRVTWSITGWVAKSYVSAYDSGECATYNNVVGFYPISKEAGHVIKTEEDLRIANALITGCCTKKLNSSTIIRITF